MKDLMGKLIRNRTYNNAYFCPNMNCDWYDVEKEIRYTIYSIIYNQNYNIISPLNLKFHKKFI